MKDFDVYELWIDAYSPESIPMDRLALYLSALARLLGQEKSVHFSRLEGGSTTTVARVEREAAPKVFEHIEAIRVAANDDDGGSPEINDLLRADNAVGRLRHRRAGAVETAVVLVFPGRNSVQPKKFGPFTEPGTVDGELMRVGGLDATDHALMRDPEGRTWSALVSRELANQLGAYLHRGIRMTGEIRWERNAEGVWKYLSFKANGFDPLDDQPLLQTVGKLRALRDSDWASNSDIDGTLNASRGHNDELH